MLFTKTMGFLIYEAIHIVLGLSQALIKFQLESL